jgi:hypothetical protein
MNPVNNDQGLLMQREAIITPNGHYGILLWDWGSNPIGSSVISNYQFAESTRENEVGKNTRRIPPAKCRGKSYRKNDLVS